MFYEVRKVKQKGEKTEKRRSGKRKKIKSVRRVLRCVALVLNFACDRSREGEDGVMDIRVQ